MRTTFLVKNIILLLLCTLSLSCFAQSDKRKELEQRRIELQQEIRRINDIRTENLRKEKSVLDEVNDLEQQIRATENLIRITNQQANLLTREISANQRRIGELRKELESLKEDYAKMIRKSYRSKSQQSRIMFLLSAESFLQAYKRLQYMKQYADYRKQQGEEIKARATELQDLNRNLSEQKSAKEDLIAENRRTREQLEKAQKAQQSLIATIRKKEGQYAAQLRRKQQEIDEIDRAIEKIIADAIAKSNEGNDSGSRAVFKLTPEAKALAANFESNKGKLPWPVKSGMVTMGFGTHPHPIVKSATMNSNGVRIATEPGAKARAVFNGVVSEILAVRGSSLMVMVRHGDYITVYNHLSSISVKKGQEVNIGQELGEVLTNKSDGRTTLYFVMYKNNQKLNPEHWIYKM